MKEVILKDFLELIEAKGIKKEWHSVMVILKSEEALTLCPNIGSTQVGTIKLLRSTLPAVLMDMNVQSFRPGVKPTVKYVIEI